jgi:hypothetical protein
MIQKEWIDTVQAVNAFAVAFLVGRPSEKTSEKCNIVAMRLEHFQALFSTPRWRLWRIDSLVKKIKSSQGSIQGAVERYKKDNSLPD